MKISGIIPARFASGRFPGKPLAIIDGKTMIQRVYEQASASGVFHRLLVATDDERIATEVRKFGGEYQFTSDGHQSGTDRCAEVAERLVDSDVIINIQGDEPLLDPRQIIALVELFKGEHAPGIGSMARKISKSEEIFDPNVVKVVLDKNDYALYFSRNTIPFIRGVAKEDWHKEGVFYKHIGMYGFKRTTLLEISKLKHGLYEGLEQLEQLRWLENGFRLQMAITDLETIGVDVPEDIKKVEALLRKN